MSDTRSQGPDSPTSQLARSGSQPSAANDLVRDLHGEAFSRTLLENLPVGVALCDQRGRFIDLNQAFADLLGLSIPEVLELSFREISPKEHADHDREQRENIVEGEQYGPYEKEFIHADGHRVPVQLSGMIVEHHGQRLVWSVAEDLRQSSDAENERAARLRALDAMERVNRIIVSSSDPDEMLDRILNEMLEIFACDRAALVHPCNPEVTHCRTLLERHRPNWPGSLAANPELPMTPGLAATMKRVLDATSPIRQGIDQEPVPDIKLARRYGVRAVMFTTLHPRVGAPWMFVLHHCARDHHWSDEEAGLFEALAGRMSDSVASLTMQREHREHLEELVERRTKELERSRRTLATAERLASLGTLAAGIAHQLNNPAGSILHAAEFALACEDDSNEREIWRRALTDSVDQAQRCGRIIKSVLQFSRGETTDKTLNDLNDVVQRACKLSEGYAAERRARLTWLLPDHPTLVVMSPIEIEQVIVNLLHNAMESSDEASLQVSLRCDGGIASLRVQDDGGGIPEELLTNVFDPFFTTRLHQGGTGLGLSVAHGIITDHGGSIEIESRHGAGTCVEIRLKLGERSDPQSSLQAGEVDRTASTGRSSATGEGSSDLPPSPTRALAPEAGSRKIRDPDR